MRPSPRYMRFLLPLAGLVVTTIIYLIAGWSRVSSVMHVATTAFSLSYLAIVFLSLIILFEHLKREPLWRGVLTGMAVGYLAGFVSYYIAVLSMPDGATRLTNSVSMLGWGTLSFTLWGLAVLLCWAWSAVGYLLVSGLSKRL